jgi:hypothetical protein
MCNNIVFNNNTNLFRPMFTDKVATRYQIRHETNCARFLGNGIIYIDPLNAQLNPICHFLALLGAHHIFHISR